MSRTVTIDVLRDGLPRPFWSVMVPTYNASDLFEKTLRSILDQDPGLSEMQIAVVDDASPSHDVEAVIRRLAPTRIEFHRQTSNVGLAKNWNSCLSLARGQLIHILHQDDLVRPHFYEKLGRAAHDHKEIGMFFCRHAFIDISEQEIALSEIERDSSGVIDNWIDRIALSQRIQCPSAVVRREVYELVGGFRPDLVYTLDWEMWVRIAAKYPVWFDPSIMACYRVHDRNETARLKQDNLDLRDIKKGIGIIAQSLPRGRQKYLTSAAVDVFNSTLLARSSKYLHSGSISIGMSLALQAFCQKPGMKTGRSLFSYSKWSLKIILRHFASFINR